MSTNYKDDLSFAEEIVREAAKIAEQINKDQLNIYEKGKYDLVTTADYEVEKFLINKITSEYKDDCIISEETRHQALTSKRTWVIDPIDGTVNYSRNIPLYGVQLALVEKMEPVAGVIFLFGESALYSACLHQGARRNGESIFVNKDVSLDRSIVSIGDFSSFNDMERRTYLSNQMLSKISKIVTRVYKIKMFGASCCDFSYLACGRTDVIMDFYLHIWDIAPGVIIAKEAGASIGKISGEPFDFESDHIIATANENVMKDLLGVLNG